MNETTSARGRIIEAAMRLAAEKPWREVSLAEIAGRAGCRLVELRGVFSSKADITAGFIEDIDDSVLAHPCEQVPGQGARDRIFEVIMSRLDALEPYKPALRSIHASGAIDTRLIVKLIQSQRWMLAAAGVPIEGCQGSIRTLGLGWVYANVFWTWLDEDDPGMARTMAALDLGLRRGERALEIVDEAAGFVGRLAEAACGGLRQARARGKREAPEASGRGDAGEASPKV